MARKAMVAADLEVDDSTGAVLVQTGPPAAAAVSSAVNVTAAGVVALAANADRRGALLVNDSDTVMYLKLGAGPAVNAGIRLNANGGSYEINGANLYQGIITAIHGGAGNKVLLITEL